eukprot:TRINITY_DN573_c0_g1_i2.p1 TRINITY_DN573_c0_g1~~TRINITY_DN573_c0_g1_i2.p1  ORF type:complete len:236 (-),score=46.91 TRINITY_DN573_c0_g1_i2:182-889(-)
MSKRRRESKKSGVDFLVRRAQRAHFAAVKMAQPIELDVLTAVEGEVSGNIQHVTRLWRLDVGQTNFKNIKLASKIGQPYFVSGVLTELDWISTLAQLQGQRLTFWKPATNNTQRVQFQVDTDPRQGSQFIQVQTKLIEEEDGTTTTVTTNVSWIGVGITGFNASLWCYNIGTNLEQFVVIKKRLDQATALVGNCTLDDLEPNNCFNPIDDGSGSSSSLTSNEGNEGVADDFDQPT